MSSNDDQPQTGNDRPMVSMLLAEEIASMLEQKRTHEARRSLVEMLPPEIADLLIELDPAHRAVAFRLLPRELSAEVYTNLPHDLQQALQEELTNEQLAQMFNEMEPDDRAELFDEMPGQLVKQLLSMMRPEERRSTQVILGYPAESVGRLMTPHYLSVQPDWSVQQTLEYIRSHGDDAESLHVLYVLDDQQRLLDEIRIRSVLLASPDATIESLMDSNVVALNARDDREEAVRVMERYDLSVLPVVDRDNIMVGIVTFDDVADVAVEETTEDIHKTGALAPLDMSYTDTSIAALVRKRVGWLVLLVGVAIVSSGVIGRYEETLEAMIVLAFFIPLLIDSGGNAGSQSATIMVRAIATGDVHLKQWLATIGKEMFVGALLGTAMGLASAALGWFRGGWEIGVIVGLAMICIVIVSNLIGTLTPFVLTRLRLDPATASSPLITTVADIAGLLIYFGIATWLIGVFDLVGVAPDEAAESAESAAEAAHALGPMAFMWLG